MSLLSDSMLSVATSIDALAVGLSLSLLQVSIWAPAVIIGVVAGLLPYDPPAFEFSTRR